MVTSWDGEWSYLTSGGALFRINRKTNEAWKVYASSQEWYKIKDSL